MQQIVIVGAETMVGHNWLKDSHSQGSRSPHDDFVVGLPLNSPASRLEEVIAGSDSPTASSTVVRRVVHCGGAGGNGWDILKCSSFANLELVRDWATACHQWHIPMTLISTDAIFTGPWMFHPETSTSICPTSEATCLRQLESAVLEASAGHLVIRSHPFGWHDKNGWIEQCLEALARNRQIEMETTRHASPIFVGELISIIQRAWAGGLSGTYHISGAERVSCAQFVQRLAQVFRLQVRRMQSLHPLEARVTRFAAGETSLQTRKIRRALGIAMPMLLTSLDALSEQEEAQGFLNQEIMAA